MARIANDVKTNKVLANKVLSIKLFYIFEHKFSLAKTICEFGKAFFSCLFSNLDDNLVLAHYLSYKNKLRRN